MKEKICSILGIKYPIVQGPMNRLTNAKLVAAVSESGGLGVLGVNVGEYKVDKTIEEKIYDLKKEIREIKRMTKKPFGINLILNHDIKNDLYNLSVIKLMKEEQVSIAVVYSEDDISEWFSFLKENNITIIYRPGTPYKELLEVAILNKVDIIAVTGFDEGGTIPEKAVGTFSAIPFAKKVIKNRVPMLAAGGVVDSTTSKAAMVLGADGLFVGTAFLMSEESPLSEVIKQKVLSMDAYDQVMYKSMPAFYRSLPGELPNKLVNMDKTGATNQEVCDAANAEGGMRVGMLEGNLKKGYASFGLGISLIDKIEATSEIMQKLVSGIDCE